MKRHRHKWTYKEKKVLLFKGKGSSSGYDILKQRMCEGCKHIETYALERKVI